jgi:two-component system sensor histidine kinase KdpD
VEAHGGSIGVDPVEPHGSTFWFELPRSGLLATC